jgi:hypothetical protein
MLLSHQVVEATCNLWYLVSPASLKCTHAYKRWNPLCIAVHPAGPVTD